jgi:hypothetical protein
MNIKGAILCACVFALIGASAKTSHAAYVTRTVQNGTQLAQAFADANAIPVTSTTSR